MESPLFEGVVLPEWIDADGSIARPTCCTTRLEWGRRIARRPATRRSRWTLIFYEREVGAGEWVRTVPSLLSADAKRLHDFPETLHAEDGHQVAPQKLMVRHRDMSAWASAFAADLPETISVAVRTYCERAVPMSAGRREAIPG